MPQGLTPRTPSNVPSTTADGAPAAITAERCLDTTDRALARSMRKRVDMALRYQRTNGTEEAAAAGGVVVALMLGHDAIGWHCAFTRKAKVSMAIANFTTAGNNGVNSRFIKGSGVLQGDDFGDELILTGPGTAYGGAGNDVLEAGEGSGNLYGGAGDDNLIGGSGAQNLYGGSGNDFLLGGTGAQNLYGGDGNDVIEAASVGAETLDGGNGYDTFYANALLNETAVPAPSSPGIDENGNAQSGLSYQRGILNAVLLRIEAIQFLDGTMQVGNLSPAAQVTRLYHTVLGRAPEASGLIGWTNAVRGGASLGTVAQAFLASPESQLSAAGQTDTQFVTQIYQTGLGRTPDAAGLSGWVAQLQSGAAQRGDVVVAISESAESQTRWGSASDQTLTWVPDERAAAVARLYDTAFAREPDIGGVSGWIRALVGTPWAAANMSLHDEAVGFLRSQGFTGLYGTLSDQGFVQLMYQNALHRATDAPGLASWTGALASGGLDRASVMLGVSESAEHQSMLVGLIETGGIVYSH